MKKLIEIDERLWMRFRGKAFDMGMTVTNLLPHIIIRYLEDEPPAGKKVLLDTTTNRPEEKEKKRPTGRSLDSTDEDETPIKKNDSRFRGSKNS